MCNRSWRGVIRSAASAAAARLVGQRAAVVAIGSVARADTRPLAGAVAALVVAVGAVRADIITVETTSNLNWELSGLFVDQLGHTSENTQLVMSAEFDPNQPDGDYYILSDVRLEIIRSDNGRFCYGESPESYLVPDANSGEVFMSVSFHRGGGNWFEYPTMTYGELVFEGASMPDRSLDSVIDAFRRGAFVSGEIQAWFEADDGEESVRASGNASAFVVTVTPTPGDCPADLNDDGIVNTQDFLFFLNAWTSGDPLADWNEDGTINTLDFLAYLSEWASDCP